MNALRAAEARMRAEGLPEPAIRAFASRFRRLAAGDTGLLPDAELEPVRDVVDVTSLPPGGGLEGAVIIKLNGGLGTSMGLRGPKSLIEAKDGHTFLDIIARQARALGRPLVLMNSFATREATPAGAEAFLQHRQPKLRADDLMPVRWPRAPALEWCPPGHGDLYDALIGSGMLDSLLERGCRYAFVSNADNLGAVLDPAILAWFAGPPDLPLIVNRKAVDPERPLLTSGAAAGDGHGRGDRRIRSRRGRARAALALRPRQDHQRPAGPPLRRLRPAAGRPARGGRSAAVRGPRPGALRAPGRFRAALPGRAAVARRL
jgi:hypothetical protein